MGDNYHPRVKTIDLMYSLLDAAKFFTDGRVYEDEDTDFLDLKLATKSIETARGIMNVPNSGINNKEMINGNIRTAQYNLDNRIKTDEQQSQLDLLGVFKQAVSTS